jgi:hypothetical protein
VHTEHLTGPDAGTTDIAFICRQSRHELTPSEALALWRGEEPAATGAATP